MCTIDKYDLPKIVGERGSLRISRSDARNIDWQRRDTYTSNAPVGGYLYFINSDGSGRVYATRPCIFMQGTCIRTYLFILFDGSRTAPDYS